MRILKSINYFYTSKLRAQFMLFKLRTYRGHNFYGKLCEENNIYTTELCRQIL
jgi:hypothetical protein